MQYTIQKNDASKSHPLSVDKMIASVDGKMHKRRKIKGDKFSSTLENPCFPQCLHLLAATISSISE